MDKKLAGLALAFTGFLLAVPAAYLVARASDEELLRLIRALFVLTLLSLGSLLGATGLLLVRGKSSRKET